MTVEQLIGAFFLALGLVSFLSYFYDRTGVRFEYFYKELGPMQERWGHFLGTVMHFAEYVATPLGFGLILVSRMVVF